jgi:hypothetical protein
MSSLPNVPAPSWLTVTMALSVMATKLISLSSLSYSSPTLISPSPSPCFVFFFHWDKLATVGLRFSPDKVVEGFFFKDW